MSYSHKPPEKPPETLDSLPQSPPVILEHPKPSVVAENTPVTLSCRVSGNPEPLVRWQKSQGPVTLNVHTTIQEAGSHR